MEANISTAMPAPAREVWERSPGAYGILGIVFDGRLLSDHYLVEKEFDTLILKYKKGD
jgi:hypothetical protein